MIGPASVRRALPRQDSVDHLIDLVAQVTKLRARSPRRRSTVLIHAPLFWFVAGTFCFEAMRRLFVPVERDPD